MLLTSRHAAARAVTPALFERWIWSARFSSTAFATFSHLRIGAVDMWCGEPPDGEPDPLWGEPMPSMVGEPEPSAAPVPAPPRVPVTALVVAVSASGESVASAAVAEVAPAPRRQRMRSAKPPSFSDSASLSALVICSSIQACEIDRVVVRSYVVGVRVVRVRSLTIYT